MNMDKILELLKKDNGTERVLTGYTKPNILKCIFGFGISVIILISLLFLFGIQFNLVYLLVLIIDILIGSYYGINLFTEKGFKSPVYENRPIVDEEENDNQDSDYDEFADDEEYDDEDYDEEEYKDDEEV